MKTKEEYRVSREGIFEHSDRLVGKEVRSVIAQVTALIEDRNPDKALAVLKAFDAEIGGMSLADMKGEKLLGVFRAISYVEFYLRVPHAAQLSRGVVQVACQHVESILKRIGRKSLLDHVVRFDNEPMGSILNKAKRDIPPLLYPDLVWLTKIYNSAKHEHDFSEMESEPVHYFDLDEAIAIYFIARTLGLRLMKMSKKTQEEFEIEA